MRQQAGQPSTTQGLSSAPGRVTPTAAGSVTGTAPPDPDGVPGGPDGHDPVAGGPLQRSDRTRLRRAPQQGSHDRSHLEAVLDAGWVCHLGVLIDGWPMVVPTTYGRRGNWLYLHGSVASRSLRSGIRQPVCVTVTHVDGIVAARSLFNHSVNYRSAMVYGAAEVLRTKEKLVGLRVIADHVVPGQWDYARGPTPQELAQTTVLRLALDLASVKTSVGPPGDGDGPDGQLPVWAGEIPVRTAAAAPITAPGVPNGITIPDHLRALAASMRARMAPPPA